MKTYQDCLKYIYSHISDRKDLKRDLELLLVRPKYLLKLLNHPQEKLRVIHIAGTSGKGSTAYLISALLQSQGFNVGLSVSPHINDIRERCQINNKYISEKEFTQTFQEIIPAIEKINRSQYGRVSYFNILIAFAFFLFWKKKVDFAVMETGFGGLYDSTNLANNSGKIAVITKIGLDHQRYLGNTYSKIAFQKAGIIQQGNNIVTIDQKESVIKVINKKAQEKKAKLFIIKQGTNIKNVTIGQNQTQFDFQFQNLNLSSVKLRLIGYHQAENAGEALTALAIASKQYKFKIQTNKVHEVLKKITVPGRFEIIHTSKRSIVVDGAHNPQKMKTFIRSLINIYPNTKFDFVISFVANKDQINTIEGMLKQITPHAKHIYVTEFTLISQDNKHRAIAFSRLQNVLSRLHFRQYTQVKNNSSLLTKLVKQKGNPLVITGSLYLISSLYKQIQKLKKSWTF